MEFFHSRKGDLGTTSPFQVPTEGRPPKQPRCAFTNPSAHCRACLCTLLLRTTSQALALASRGPYVRFCLLLAGATLVVALRHFPHKMRRRVIKGTNIHDVMQSGTSLALISLAGHPPSFG